MRIDLFVYWVDLFVTLSNNSTKVTKHMEFKTNQIQVSLFFFFGIFVALT